MKYLAPLCCLFLATSVLPLKANDPAPIALSAALANHQIVAEISHRGHDEIDLKLRNPSAAALAINVPAGLVAADPKGQDRMVVLRAATAALPAQGVADVVLPAASLSSTAPDTSDALTFSPQAEPKLDGLLKWLANQPDAPRTTAQLAVFGLLENISFASWEKYLAANRPANAPVETAPTPAEIAQAIDALGILREVAPQQTFALATDNDLKLRALRNPWCRVKAMKLYGLDFGDGALPPDLGQLLHTKPGDNCPICRQRALLQQSPSDL